MKDNDELPPPIARPKTSDLQDMLSKSLKDQGIDVDARRKGLQQKTVPLIQPQRIQPTSAPAVAVATRAASSSPSAKKASPTAATEPSSSKASFIALALMGVLALSAAGGAAWFAKNKPAGVASAPVAANGTTAPVASEGAVSFSVAARPGETPNTGTLTAPPAMPTPEPVVAAAPVAAAAPVVAPEPKPRTVTASAPKPEPAEPRAKPEPKPRAEVAPKPEPKPKPAEKTAAAEEKKPAAAPAHSNGSVDAILQQQLQSAIP